MNLCSREKSRATRQWERWNVVSGYSLEQFLMLYIAEKTHYFFKFFLLILFNEGRATARICWRSLRVMILATYIKVKVIGGESPILKICLNYLLRYCDSDVKNQNQAEILSFLLNKELDYIRKIFSSKSLYDNLRDSIYFITRK